MIPDKAYEIAVARAKEVAEQISKFRNKLATLEREQADLETFITMYHKLAGITPLTGMETPPPVDSTQNPNPPKERVGDFAAEWMKRNQRPIPRKELLQQLEYEGLKLYGKEPEKVLSTMMWRMQDRFVLLQGFGYWLKDQPYAPAKYQPTINLEVEVDKLFS